MVQLVCQCLNVHIDCPGPISRIEAKLNLSKAQEKNQFFIKGCTEARLKANDINQQIPCLCSSEVLEEWFIHRCLNCNTFTHAVHTSKGLDRVLLSKTLISDKTSVEELKNSPDYSQIFGLILAKFRDNFAIANVHTHNPVVKAATESIEANVQTFLKREQELSDKRIQSYKDEQQKKLSNLKDRAIHDKEVLIAAISNCAQLNLEKSLQSAADDIAGLSLSNKDNDLKNVNETSSAGQKKSTSFTSSFTKSTPIAAVMMPRERTSLGRHFSVPSSAFIDDVFDMEGFDEPCDSSPYFHSDDDNDTDESSLNDDVMSELGSQGTGAPSHLYASSLPVSMPGFQPCRSRHSSEEDEQTRKVQVPVDPRTMAASIKALAMSVKCSDGTEMFGELPGHKMKTTDIALSRMSTFDKRQR